MKYCQNCKHAKIFKLSGSSWCEGPALKITNYISPKGDYAASRCLTERSPEGFCKPEAKYYEPNFLTRAREFFLGAKP